MRSMYNELKKVHGIKVVFFEEQKEDMINKANKDAKRYIVLIDPDVDHVVIYDKEKDVAYPQSIKGYELSLDNKLKGAETNHIYIEEYLDNKFQN